MVLTVEGSWLKLDLINVYDFHPVTPICDSLYGLPYAYGNQANDFISDSTRKVNDSDIASITKTSHPAGRTSSSGMGGPHAAGPVF